jgi:hypothetical protein
LMAKRGVYYDLYMSQFRREQQGEEETTPAPEPSLASAVSGSRGDGHRPRAAVDA